jgi:predicted acyltransferase
MQKERLISLDAFRGFTIAAMILVNNPGSWEHVYAPLLHKEWNGITPTDLIFPFFLFIVGVSIVLAYSKRIDAGVPAGQMVRKILFRSLKIFGVGVLLNFLFVLNFSELRIAGVLQRIAIVFLVCSLMFLFTSWRTQLITGIVILIGYWMAMVLIPTPGYDKPMLEPGMNLAAWIDSKLLPGKMWEGTWDPEGILSTFPAIATGIAGMMAGLIITSRLEKERKVLWLFTAGFLATIVGHAWGWVFPLNKNLWTSSYVVFTGGLAFMTLAASIFIVDILGRKRFTKVGIVFGANAIAIYVLADLLTLVFYGMKIGGSSLNVHFMNLCTGMSMAPKLASLIYALMYIAVNYIPAWLLYRKRIFIKL